MTDRSKMTGFSRRKTFGFAGVLATVAAGSLMSRVARAQDTGGSGAASPSASPTDADRTQKAGPGWHRVEIGNARITTVLDGERKGDGPYPTFGADQSQETVGDLMEANFLPRERYVNGFTPTLVDMGDDLLLFDTGFGEDGKANGYGKLVERMGDAGYRPEDVDIVVLTHLHGDHIQGLMANGEPTFSNARYVVGQKEYDFWTSDEAKNGKASGNAELVQKKVVPLRDKMSFVSEGDEVVPGLTAIEAFGHTPGHMIFELQSDGQRLMLAADTSNHFVASLQKPEWEVAFDMDHDQATATRKRVFDRLAEERIPFIGYHMPFPAIGYAEKLQDGGYRFIPETYQLSVEEKA